MAPTRDGNVPHDPRPDQWTAHSPNVSVTEMRLVMTVMVRDEADVIEAMVRHHLNQGLDEILVTDNGSVDGTREILQRIADEDARLHIDDEPIQRKQQAETVTRMARSAAVDYGADWVINADADEFWLPQGAATLHEAFARYPSAWGAFLVPVHDMIGAPAFSGSGFGRLLWQDHRPIEVLRRSGMFAHSTPDAVHVGDPGVEVVQGNHAVSIPSAGAPEPGAGVEVLHLQWRSWTQFRRKVENAGRAYESNPTLNPSPNHHGMRDYRMLKAGTLLASYLLRHPGSEELKTGLAAGHFVPEHRIADLEQYGVADVTFSEDEALDSMREHDREVFDEIARLREEITTRDIEIAAYRNRRVVKLADRARGLLGRPTTST
jgi:hypothetical protein